MAADVLPPEDIDDLTMTSGPRGGTLNLFWSAPADDQNGGDIINGWYRVDFSSDPSHVFAPGTFRLQFSTNTTAHQPQWLPLGSLAGNATYYTRVVAADDVPNWSGLSNGATAMTPAYAPSDAGHGSQAVDSLGWTWSTGTNKPGTLYLAQDESAQSGWQADALGWTSAGRSANTLYHLTVKARNDALLESASASTQAYTSIETPAVLVFPEVGPSSITARIQPTPSNLTAGGSGARFTNVTLGTDSGWVQSSSWPMTGLAANTQYMFTAKARNGDKDETPQGPPAFRVSGIQPPADADMSVTFLSTADISLSVTAPPNPAFLQTGSEFVNVQGGAAGGDGSGRLTGVYAFTDHDLLPNTSYGYRVGYYNGDGVPSGFGPVRTLYTQIEVPSLVFDSVGPNYISARAIGTLSNLDAGLSGLRILNLTRGASSGWVQTRTWTSADLSSNTAYSFATQARNGDGVNTAQSGALVRITLLETPPVSALSLTDRTSAQMTVNLAAPPNPILGQTGCEIELVEGPGGDGSGRLTGAYSYTDSGLSANTRYGYRARYFNAEGVATAYSGTLYGYTLSAPPLAAAYSDGGDFQMRANWGANGNAAGTVYVAELSTDAFGTLVASSSTANTQVLFTGLEGETTYYARVKAFNAEGLATGYTLLGSTRTWSTTPKDPGHLGQTQAQVSWTWAWGADHTAASEFYASDETGASGWVAGAAAWTGGGKAANTLYHMSVKARNASGEESAAVSTAAYTAIEAAAGVGVDATYPSSLTVRALGAISNVGAGASAVLLGNESGGDSGWGANVPWTSVGLSSNTAYTFRARTRNGDAEEPGPGVTVTAYTALNAPLAGVITLVAESSAAMRVSLRQPPNSAAGQTGCEFEAVEGPGGTGSGSLTAVYSYLDAGLSMNTRYGYRARYFNADGLATEYGSVRTAYTLSAEPSAAAYSGATETSLQANWGANGNPDGIRYGVQVSSNDFVSVAATSVTANRFALFTGLKPDTTYAGRVASLNAEGMPSAWIALDSTWTYADPPLSPAVALAGGPALTLAWQANSNPVWTVYEAQVSTSADFYPVHASSRAAALTIRVSGLDHSTTYYARVRAWGRNGAASVFVSAGSTVTVSDAAPPDAITDLQAWTGDTEGRIRLTWTTPTDPVSGKSPSVYFVRYSPAPILGWPDFDAALAYAQSWAPGAPGAREDRMLDGFTPGATYYIAVVSEDESFNRSGLPDSTSAWAQWDVTPPSQVPDFQVVSITSSSALLRWTAPGDDAALGRADRYELRMSPLGPLDTLERFLAAKSTTVPAPSTAGQTDQSLITGLAEATTYYFALRTADERLNWSPVSAVVRALTLNKEPPAAPRWAVPASSAAHGSATLYWLANAEDDLAGYRVWRAASSGGPYAQALSAERGALSAAESGLNAGASVYYVLTAVDSAGLESQRSAELEVYVPDIRAPGAVPGLKGLLGDDGRYTLQWSGVGYDADGSPSADLAGYRIYRAAGRGGPYALEAALPAAALAWTEPAAAGPGYFLVRAVDLHGNESADSHVCAPDLALSAASADGGALARVPASVAEPMYRATNGMGDDIRVTVERRAAEEGDKTLLSYAFTPLKAGTLQPAGDTFSFPRPRVEVTFKVPGNARAAVYRYDGAEWVRLGGEMDPATGLITVQTARLGRFQVRQASRAESFTILQMTPRRIFTPNGDGINDVIEFFFENDADWVVSEAKVYDLSGAEVSAMRTGSTGSSYVWDGKDRSGQVVHGGIYIYQFQAGGKTLNGTVVVAK